MQLEWARVPAKDLVAYYCACIRSSPDYACPVFYYSLPQYLQSELESVQKRALACIFPRMPYREALEGNCLTSIREHHEDITKLLFRSISENQNSKLYHLRACPCKNRPLKFSWKMDCLHFFYTSRTTYAMNENGLYFDRFVFLIFSGIFFLGTPKTTQTGN